MSRKSLALAIPTYNRPDILEENLLAMQASLERLDIAVHVLDDSSTDDTAKGMARLAATTRIKLIYRRNQPPLRHDANLISALAAPDTDFVWLLGDGCVIDDASLQAVHDQLQGQDFVFVNSRERQTRASESCLRDAQARSFIAERAWDFSYTGASIYARRVIEWWCADPAHQPHANFPQLSVVLAYLGAHRRVRLSWVGQRVVRSHPRKKQSYWLTAAIPVWAGDWYRVITANAGAFDAVVLSQVLRSHSKQTGVLGFKHLMVMRAEGLLDGDVLSRYRMQLSSCSTMGRLGVRAIAMLPRAAAQALVTVRSSWRRRFLPPRATELRAKATTAP